MYTPFCSVLLKDEERVFVVVVSGLHEEIKNEITNTAAAAE
jgi:hypothetical protein